MHDYDAEVDDLSRDGQSKNAARLHKALDALTAIDPATLSAGDRDRSRDADCATAAVFNLVHCDFAPLADRLRSVIARERQIPMLLTTGKANIEHPPRAFVEIAIRNVAGSIDLLKTGAPAAFAAVEDQKLNANSRY